MKKSETCKEQEKKEDRKEQQNFRKHSFPMMKMKKNMSLKHGRFPRNGRNSVHQL